jgi:hypothetical protein
MQQEYSAHPGKCHSTIHERQIKKSYTQKESMLNQQLHSSY